MKNIFLALVILIPSICFSQDLPVKLTIHSQPLSDDSYILLMNIKIKDGWPVYAKRDTSSGVGTLTIRLANNNIEISDETSFNPIDMVDSLFGNKPVCVFINENVFQKVIKVPQQIKSLPVTLTGLASNQKKVCAY